MPKTLCTFFSVYFDFSPVFSELWLRRRHFVSEMKRKTGFPFAFLSTFCIFVPEEENHEVSCIGINNESITEDYDKRKDYLQCAEDHP